MIVHIDHSSPSEALATTQGEWALAGAIR
jgi:hypothetical protein